MGPGSEKLRARRTTGRQSGPAGTREGYRRRRGTAGSVWRAPGGDGTSRSRSLRSGAREGGGGGVQTPPPELLPAHKVEPASAEEPAAETDWSAEALRGGSRMLVVLKGKMHKKTPLGGGPDLGYGPSERRAPAPGASPFFSRISEIVPSLM